MNESTKVQNPRCKCNCSLKHIALVLGVGDEGCNCFEGDIGLFIHLCARFAVLT